MHLIPEFLPKDMVYLKTDIEQLPRIVISYRVTHVDITYELCCGMNVSCHYGFELSTKKVSSEIDIKGFGG